MAKKGLIFILLALVSLSCGEDQVPKLIARPHPKAQESDKHKNLTLTFRPVVDILFVVDNSGSMDVHQGHLSDNAGKFTKALFSNVLIDYHIGVTTSDMDPDGERGALVGWIDKNTPHKDQVLQQLLVRGTGGSYTEHFFEPVIAALSPPKVDTINKGFYRENAFLATVFVTDSRNDGPVTADGFFKFLLGLKKFDEAKILGYAAFIPPGEVGCERDPDGEPVKIYDYLVNYVKNDGVKNYFSLCSDFGPGLARIGQDLENRIELFVPVKGPLPEVDTIVVTYGSQIVPRDFNKGWSWNVERRGIRLGRELDIKDQPNAVLNITYRPANLKQK